MAKQRVLTNRKAGIAALIALLLAVVLFCAWLLSVALLSQVSDILPGPSPSVTTPSQSPATPALTPAQETTEPARGPMDADARVDIPQQG